MIQFKNIFIIILVMIVLFLGFVVLIIESGYATIEYIKKTTDA